MYIAPNTNLRLLRNVPLEPDYVNTLYFASLSAQTTYFQSMTKYNLTAQSYQRHNKGVCRVNYKAEDLFDCNYMMFQNASFGNKWFYAFIKSIDYVNNVTSDIHYEMDVMQTWLKDFTLTRCFVEREHSATDAIGDNIVAEPVDTGELVFNYYEKISEDLDNTAIVMVIADADRQDYGNSACGIYSGCLYKVFPNNTSGGVGVNSEIRDYYIQHPEEVVAVYIVPYASLPIEPTNSGYELNDASKSWYHEYSQETIVPKVAQQFKYMLTTNDTLDGYKPRNNKLYTYPYNLFHVDNANGRELNLRFEFFSDLKPRFMLSCTPMMPVTCVLRPYNYKSVQDMPNGDADLSAHHTCCTESIDLTGYPMCSWSYDTYTAWVAQNSVPEGISILNKATSIGANVAQGHPVSAIQNIVSGVSDILVKRYQASIASDVCKGSLNNSNVNLTSEVKKHNFFCGRMSVTNGIARIIDDFFDRFGYATNRLKVPNISSRPAWNYVKTVGSNVGGSIPSDDKRAIDNIFNNGITFWKDPTKVDDYTQSNAPTP